MSSWTGCTSTSDANAWNRCTNMSFETALGRLQQVRTEPLRRDPRSVLQEIPDTGGNYLPRFANGPEPLEGKSPSQVMPERGCISRETAVLLRNSAQNRA